MKSVVLAEDTENHKPHLELGYQNVIDTPV